MTEPESLERERASDVPEGAEVRADGSYATPVENLTDEQRAMLPDPDEAAAAAEADEEARLAREEGAQDSPPREVGTRVASVDGAQ